MRAGFKPAPTPDISFKNKYMVIVEGSVAETEKFASNRDVGAPHKTPNNCYYYICCRLRRVDSTLY